VQSFSNKIYHYVSTNSVKISASVQKSAKIFFKTCLTNVQIKLIKKNPKKIYLAFLKYEKRQRSLTKAKN